MVHRSKTEGIQLSRLGMMMMMMMMIDDDQDEAKILNHSEGEQPVSHHENDLKYSRTR